jgi:hypothetical protein
MNDELWTVDDEQCPITERAIERYLREAEELGARLIAFGRKVRTQRIRLLGSLFIVHCSS